MVDSITLMFERMTGVDVSMHAQGSTMGGLTCDRMAVCHDECTYYDPATDNCRLLVTPQRPCNSHYKRLLQGGYGHPSNECLWNKERTSTVKE